MKLKKSSIRIRLTLWYAAVLLIILSIVSFGVYAFMHSRMESMAQSKLDSDYTIVENVVKFSFGDLYDVLHLGQTSMFLITKEFTNVYYTEAWENVHFTIKFDKESYKPYRSWRSPEGRFFKIKQGTIPEVGYELAFAQDITEIKENLRTLLTILLAGIPCALILALIGGYILAGRALSPVSAITQKAHEITAESLSERLPVSNPNDEIGRLATVFNETLARLENSFDRLRRFTADASHELRTPLTSIRSVGEVALQSPINGDAYREAISSMLEETERLTQLIDNLLTLTRGGSGKIQLNPQPTDLTSLVQEIMNALSILAEDKNQALSRDGLSTLIVTIDSATIRQAVMNVLHNAIRYTQAGGCIQVLIETASDGQAIIDIIDDGPGIPEDERTKVFGRFYRVDEARSREEGGAGLGLAIAQWAVEANKGRIEFCDKEGPGSCCRITLPMN
jgi:heavy metal sensor kinase